MDAEETERQLADTMEIIKDIFLIKCHNSDLVIENKGHNGWFYLDNKTAKKLKRQLIKYQTRK